MNEFIHLQCHSYYSFMRGVSSLTELCRTAAELKMRALALTDLNGVYGSVWFWERAREAGLNPILGAEVATDSERAVLLAKDRRGWERLCEILTDRHLEHNFSLAPALIADRTGLVTLASDPALIRRVAQETGTSDLYVALPPGRDSLVLLSFARELGLAPVATGDVYFARPDQYERHRLLRAIALNTTLSRAPASELAHPGAFLSSPREIADRFPHCPEAVANAGRIAEQCLMSEPPWSGILFPDFEGLGPDETFQLLRAKCRAGAIRRYGKITEAVEKRLEHELSVIRAKGFASYFLVVEDVVQRFPITCGRGSAAASIVSYALMITQVDPIRHDLFFERFLNPGRVDPPDIDVDFPWDERDGVLDYVFKKYGERNAAMVANHVSLQARAAVREVAKVFGLPPAEIQRVTGRMRYFWRAEGLENFLDSHPVMKGRRLPPPWPEVIRLAGELEGTPRNLSVHCGGVVIAPGKLVRRVPLMRAAKGVNIIQWEKDQTEDGGLVKIDLLGNRSLAVVRDALTAVEEHQGVENLGWGRDILVAQKEPGPTDCPTGLSGSQPQEKFGVLAYQHFNPLDDLPTQDLLARGDTIGVFYVESPAMRQLQKKTRRGDFERLVVHSSIIRPAANEFIREYVRRLRGGSYEPQHPALSEILAETFGIMVYQEDVCKVAMALAGFDAVDGDGLRKIMSKKHRTQKLAEYRERFERGAIERGVSREVIERVWAMIMSFSGYSFCKPHSASYALVSFKSAWLRRHHPAEFMAAVISNQGGFYSTFAYLSEARRMGLRVLGPDVNASEEHYTGRDKELRVGLMQLKGLNAAALQALLAERKARGKYRGWADFLWRVSLAPSDARLLIKAGCFDGLEGEAARPALLWELAAHESRGGRARAHAPTLFDPLPAALPRPPGYDEPTMLRHEAEVLGFLVSRHPLTLYLHLLKPLSYVQAKDLPRWVGKRVTTLGWYVTGKMTETKHGEPMEFLSFEDTTAIYETTFFPEAYRKFCSLIDHDRPYLLSGKVEEDFGAVSLTVEHVRFLEPPRGGVRLEGVRLEEERLGA